MKNYIIPYGERFVQMGQLGFHRHLMCVDNLGLVVIHDSKEKPTAEEVRNHLVGWQEHNTQLVQANSLEEALQKFLDYEECKTGMKHKAWEMVDKESNPVIEYPSCDHMRFTPFIACGYYDEPQENGCMNCVLSGLDEESTPDECPIANAEKKRIEVVQIGGVWVRQFHENVKEMIPQINVIKPRGISHRDGWVLSK